MGDIMSRQVIYAGGKRFTVITDESEVYMRKLTEKLDTRLRSIASSNPQLDRDSVAILASLDYCDEENKLREQLSDVKIQISEYLENVVELHREIDALKAENEKLKNRLEAIKNFPVSRENGSDKVVIATGKVKHNETAVTDGAVQQSLFEYDED